MALSLDCYISLYYWIYYVVLKKYKWFKKDSVKEYCTAFSPKEKYKEELEEEGVWFLASQQGIIAALTLSVPDKISREDCLSTTSLSSLHLFPSFPNILPSGNRACKMKKNWDLQGHSGDLSRNNKMGEIEFFYVRLSLHARLLQSVSIGGWPYRTSCIRIPLNGHEKGLGPGGTKKSSGVLRMAAWVFCHLWIPSLQGILCSQMSSFPEVRGNTVLALCVLFLQSGGKVGEPDTHKPFFCNFPWSGMFHLLQGIIQNVKKWFLISKFNAYRGKEVGSWQWLCHLGWANCLRCLRNVSFSFTSWLASLK